jgi:hypothetical protein
VVAGIRYRAKAGRSPICGGFPAFVFSLISVALLQERLSGDHREKLQGLCPGVEFPREELQ